MTLVVKPIDLKSANAFVLKHHRHNGAVLVHRFSISVYDGDTLVGVAICGNPSARRLDDGETIEVKRCCTDGTRNACSILYGRCARIAKEMGYKRIITYILQSEIGVTMRACGWAIDAENVGSNKGWDVPSRPREIVSMDIFGNETEHYKLEKKTRYQKTL